MWHNVIMCAIDISCFAGTADRRSSPSPRALPRSCLYCRFYSDCNSGIIDRRHCEIHKPTARFIAPPPPRPSPSLPLAWPPPRLAFCDRRLTPRRYRRRDNIRPRSGIAPDKSSQMFCLPFSLPFFRPPLLPDDRSVAKLFTRKLKSGDGRKYAMLMIF